MIILITNANIFTKHVISRIKHIRFSLEPAT